MIKVERTRLAVLVAGSAVGLSGAAGDAAADVQTRTIVLSNTNEGQAGGGLLKQFGNARINDAGETLFWARSTRNSAQMNDECATAIPIGLGTHYFSTAGATSSTPGSCQAWSDVWFEFVAPASTQYHITVHNTDFSPRFGVQTGTCAMPIPGGCQGFGGTLQPVFPNLTAGQVVKIRIGGSQSNTITGTGFLTIKQNFVSGYNSPSPIGDGALWSDRSGALMPVLVEGAATSFDGALTHQSTALAAFSANGDIAVVGAAMGTAVTEATRAALFVLEADGIPGQTELVLLEAVAPPPQPPPPQMSGPWILPSPVSIDEAGQLAWAGLNGSELRYGGTTIAAGSTAPNMGDATFLFMDQPSRSRNGQTAFRATVAGTGFNATNNQGLWRDAGAAPHLVARHSSPAHGTEVGVTFEFFGIKPSLNDAGRLAFHATLIDMSGSGQVTPANDAGVWVQSAGFPINPTLLVREGSPTPGLGVGTVASVGVRPQINNRGEVLVTGFIAGDGVSTSDNGVIWLFQPNGSTRVVAREGNPANVPGLPAALASFGEPVLGDDGHVAYVAQLTGDGVGQTNNKALFLAYPGTHGKQIARIGEAFPINDAEFRNVRDIVLGSGVAAEGNGALNASGELIYQLFFTDGTTGLFASTIVCPADIDGNGKLNVPDIFGFLSLWFAMNPAADFDGSTVVDEVDIFAYLAAWFAGC